VLLVQRYFTMSATIPDSNLEDSAPLRRDEARILVGDILDAASNGEFSARHVLEQHPWLNNFPSCVIDLAYEEYCQSRESGKPIAASVFVAQFAGVEQSLYRVIEFDQVLHDHPSLVEEVPENRWPRVGTDFCGFHLLEQIGRGAFSRVFIARQAELGNRYVVVKICIRGEREADLLGMLEFEGIAKVYSMHPDAATGLVTICMPLETRVTMHHLAEWVTTRPASGTGSRLRGRELRKFVAECNVDFSKKKGSSTESNERRISRFLIVDEDTFSTAVLKWGIQLSHALQHAHGNKVLHCDVKPGNVLLMPDLSGALLDFNLAASEKDAVRLAGGTLPYMASEQLLLLLNTGAAPQRANPDKTSPTVPDLSGATDVFGLCATLWHLATGTPPFGATIDVKSRSSAANLLLARQTEGVSQEQCARIANVLPAKLISVLLKGLSFNAGDRQATAAVLASELENLLPRRRLFRGPLAYCLLMLCVGVLAVAGGAVQSYRIDSEARFQTAESVAAEARTFLLNEDFIGAEVLLEPFKSNSSECRFLHLYCRTCELRSPVYEVPGRVTAEQHSLIAEWRSVEAEWVAMTELSQNVVEAWVNCFYVRLELADFDGALEAFRKAEQSGMKRAEMPRLSCVFDSLSRMPDSPQTSIEHLAAVERQLRQDGTRGELLAFLHATAKELDLNSSLTDGQSRQMVNSVLSFLDGVHSFIAEPSVAFLFTKSRFFLREKSLCNEVVAFSRNESDREFNHLNHVFLLPTGENVDSPKK